MTTSIPIAIPSDPAALSLGGESGSASANSLLGAFATVLGSDSTTAAGALPGSFDQLMDAPPAGVISVALNPPLSVFTAAPGGLPTASESVPGGADYPSGTPAVEPESPPAIPAEQSASTASQITLGRGNLFVRGRIVSAEIGESDAAQEAAALGLKDTPGSEKRLENQRDLIEAAAALLVTLWPVLPPGSLPTADPAPTGEEGTPVANDAENLPSAGASSSGPVVVIKLADQPAFRLSLPSLKTETDAPLGQILAQTRELIAGKLAELPENIEARVAGAVSAGKAGERLNSPESAEPEAPVIELEWVLPTTPTDVAEPEVANFAVVPRPEKPETAEKNYSTEKNFLNPKAERVKTDKTSAGIDVAESASDMPEIFTAHRYTSDQPVFTGPGTAREAAPALSVASTAPVDPTPTPTPTPAAREISLAHRAVETILNVVDAQRSRAEDASVVNLHFKFAGEDLAVRVQLRGGEVHTQFRTDSAELRAALANEWRAVAGQGGEPGARLIEPVFAGSGASGQHGFGSAPHGQSSSQQHAQQQQQQAQGPAVLPELRALRRDAGRAPAAAIESAPRPAAASPTSQHLTAFA